MSISRKNWSALSSLARQWTVEDEEEVEREKRRRVKSSSSAADPDTDFSQTPGGDTPTGDSTRGTASSETSQGLSSVEQMQLDFVEMLRDRDERRRMRHVETLRRQKVEEEEEEEEGGGGGGARVELLGDLDDDGCFDVTPSSKPQQQAPKTASLSPRSSISTSSNDTVTNAAHRQCENGESSSKDRDSKPISNPTRKFVSSVSISLDKSPSVSGAPMSPCSPTPPFSPREHSFTSMGVQSPVQNGHTQETSVNGSSGFEQTTKPAFVRQSSRTISFRMMKKKEEDSSPLQRSASVRMTSKKFESNTEQNPEDDKTPSFQRNSRQRLSSRSIQEKMERLAQAAQKSEMTRSPDVAQRTLFLMEEVSRKRGIFEKDQQQQQAASPSGPGVTRQEFRNFTSGMSDRISRWINKTNQSGSSHCSTDLRHVDITSKRGLFENRDEDSVSNTSTGKMDK